MAIPNKNDAFMAQEHPETDSISQVERRSKLRLSFGRLTKSRTPQVLTTSSRTFFSPTQSKGRLELPNGKWYEFVADDLTDLGEIGRGAFGTVNQMIHKPSGTTLAVKRIRSTSVDEKEQRILNDLAVVMKSHICPHIVRFYGAIFQEGDCWICMELMDACLDQFYHFVYEKLDTFIPEDLLAQITVATVEALHYLKETLKIIHRDVKPSNILVNHLGHIKLCDFGISGQLIDSIARTRDIGCRPYMAPERIDPEHARGYDVRSDVWSLGITLMELATGSFPYPEWNCVFDQLTQVVKGEAPRLLINHNGRCFSPEFVDFVNTCLIKDEAQRPKYRTLLQHPFIVHSKQNQVDVSSYFQTVLDQMLDAKNKLP